MPDYDDARTQPLYDDHDSSTLVHTISAGVASERSSHDLTQNGQAPLGASPTGRSRLSSESIGGGDGSRTTGRSLHEGSIVDTQSPPASADVYVEDVVQPGFDESILRALCDMDVSAYFHCCHCLLSRSW